MNHLLNSAVMPQPGTYLLESLTASQFGRLLREEPFRSYIGYPETARILEELFGVPIPVSRDQTRLETGDRMLIVRLRYRVSSPGQKGYVNPAAEDFEWFRCWYEETSMAFGKTLQRIRRAKGKTQRDVARKIGMDYSYFSRLENDRFDSKPTRETIGKIAEALACTEEERGELLSSAGRIDEELENAARIASENPALGKLFRAVVHLPPDRVAEILEQVQRDRIFPGRDGRSGPPAQ